MRRPENPDEVNSIPCLALIPCLVRDLVVAGGRPTFSGNVNLLKRSPLDLLDYTRCATTSHPGHSSPIFMATVPAHVSLNANSSP